MSGWWAERFASFDVAVTPTISAGGAPVATAAVNLPVSLDFSMDGAGISPAAMTLVLTPSVSFVGINLLGTYSLDLVSSIGMAATGTSTAAFDLAVTPGIGISGAETYTASFTLVVTPAFPMAAATKELPHAIPWTI